MDSFRSLLSDYFELTWLPAGAYHARRETEACSIGFAYTPQLGQHAIGSDTIRPFQRRANTLAYIPSGCDVYSESMQGGDYLLLSFVNESDVFGDVVSSNLHCDAATLPANILREHLLLGRGNCLEVEHNVQLLIESYIAVVHSEELRYGGLTGIQLIIIDDMVFSNLHQTLRISDLAAELGLSTGYFNRAFKYTTSITPYRYILHRRLARANEMLRQRRWVLADIATSCGFYSAAAFCAAYKKTYGVSPVKAYQ